jgi:anti-sigma factor (TIGR02949 family)
MSAPDRYDCEEALRRLEDFLDRELTPEEMILVQAHLDTCTACTERFAFERQVLDGLRDKIRRISLPPDLRASISRSLDRERRAAEG